MRVLVTGSIAYDILLGYDGRFADSLHNESNAISVVYLTSHYTRHHGGTCANISWGLSLLGDDPLPVCTVGSDGGPYKVLLHARGIDVRYIEQIESDVTSTAIIGSDTVENQVGFFHAGADQKGTWPDLNEDRDDIGYAIISPRDEGVMMRAIAWCKTNGVPYMFDPGQRITSMSDDDLRRSIEGSFALICNEYEWHLIGKRLGMNEESVLLHAKHLIVTRGENGITCFGESETVNVAACPADAVVNPTGAGDAARAGILAGLSRRWSMRDSLRLGAVMGSFAVEIAGTLMTDADLEALRLRAAETYGEELPQL